ncbi:MAG: hypothetical protein IPM56_07905 [Ignavibacteriales bacterium]|nr:MAG: hypothetical protein IPM56_07905 [Ignavibacteriales bacterium]
MERLRLETFFSSDQDAELNQYKILGGIKIIQQEFNSKKLYPALSELIKLNSQLTEIINGSSNLKISFPKRIKDFDFRNKKIVYEKSGMYESVDYLFDLIGWALPLIQNVIEEGVVLYEFVEKNLELGEIGIVPIYKEEGYFVIRDNINKCLKVFKFECSLFTSDKVPYRALKTEHVRDFSFGEILFAPASLKLELVRYYPEMPNPAIYLCDTELDFPFSETIFPIAKRKLMTTLAS